MAQCVSFINMKNLHSCLLVLFINTHLIVILNILFHTQTHTHTHLHFPPGDHFRFLHPSENGKILFIYLYLKL